MELKKRKAHSRGWGWQCTPPNIGEAEAGGAQEFKGSYVVS